MHARRFDADRQDRELTLEQAVASPPGRRQLLWIDVVGDLGASEAAAIGRRLDLDAQTRRALTRPGDRPGLAVHGSYVHLTVAAEPVGPGPQSVKWLDVVAGADVVITRHADRLALLDDIDERVKADSTLGAVEGPEFVALVLDGVVTSYFAAVDAVEDELDRLDARSLRDDGRRELLGDLVRLRRRVAALRRLVTDHRSVFASLPGPEIRQLVDGREATGDLQAVAARFESAVGAVEASREALLGSFDVYMTRTAQRTNDVMKVLTIATVLLLPGSVLAGVLGMNVVVPLDKDDPMSFWLAVGAIGIIAVVVLVAARLRRWI